MRKIAIVIVGATLLAACSNGSSNAGEVTATTEPAATVEQFASVVAEQAAAIAKAREGDTFCETSTIIDCVSFSGAYNRTIAVLDEGVTLAARLQTMGTPPDEIAKLVERTDLQGQYQQLAWDAVNECTDDVRASGDATPCWPKLEAARATNDAMDDIIAAWAPYL